MNSNLVRFVCRAKMHVDASRNATVAVGSPVTIHDGAWAYCDGAGSDDAHRWSATGGVPLESLVRWTAPNGAPAEVHAAAPVNGGGRTPQFAVRPTNGTAAKTARKTPGVPRI